MSLDKLWLIKTEYQRTWLRRELTERFATGSVRSLVESPDRGWICEIRDALGMSTRQLADRMRISQPAVTQIERSEARGRVQLDTLRKAADALGCDLVYALVPRTSLEQARRDQALNRATSAFTSEGSEDPEVRRGRIEHYADRLLEGGHIWDDAGAR